MYPAADVRHLFVMSVLGSYVGMYTVDDARHLFVMSVLGSPGCMYPTDNARHFCNVSFRQLWWHVSCR